MHISTISLTRTLLIAVFSLVISACGSESETQTLSDENFIELEAADLPAIKFPYKASSTVTSANNQLNDSVAEFIYPEPNSEFVGNLTVKFTAGDPQGIAKILLGFNGSESALTICEENCGTEFLALVNGVNPVLFGWQAGLNTLSLWIQDNDGNLMEATSVEVNWQPLFIENLVLTYDETTETLSAQWSPLEGMVRYNAYLAEEPGIEGKNIINLEGGESKLALTETQAVFTEKPKSAIYYVKVTGIDGSGESAFSDEISIVNGGEAPVPIANSDDYSIEMNTVLTGNVLSNDSILDSSQLTIVTPAESLPTNGTLELLADGSFTYSANTDFIGSDMFSYKVQSQYNTSATGQVTITVTGEIDDRPLLNGVHDINGDGTNDLIAQLNSETGNWELQFTNSVAMLMTHNNDKLDPFESSLDGSFFVSIDKTSSEFIVSTLFKTETGHKSYQLVMSDLSAEARIVTQADSAELPTLISDTLAANEFIFIEPRWDGFKTTNAASINPNYLAGETIQLNQDNTGIYIDRIGTQTFTWQANASTITVTLDDESVEVDTRQMQLQTMLDKSLITQQQFDEFYSQYGTSYFSVTDSNKIIHLTVTDNYLAYILVSEQAEVTYTLPEQLGGTSTTVTEDRGSNRLYNKATLPQFAFSNLSGTSWALPSLENVNDELTFASATATFNADSSGSFVETETDFTWSIDETNQELTITAGTVTYTYTQFGFYSNASQIHVMAEDSSTNTQYSRVMYGVMDNSLTSETIAGVTAGHNWLSAFSFLSPDYFDENGNLYPSGVFSYSFTDDVIEGAPSGTTSAVRYAGTYTDDPAQYNRGYYEQYAWLQQGDTVSLKTYYNAETASYMMCDPNQSSTCFVSRERNWTVHSIDVDKQLVWVQEFEYYLSNLTVDEAGTYAPVYRDRFAPRVNSYRYSTTESPAQFEIIEQNNGSEDNSLTIDLFANVSEESNLSLLYASTEMGSISYSVTGEITYTPNDNFSGTDTINYAIVDANGNVYYGSLTVTIEAVNDAPTLGLQSYEFSIEENNAIVTTFTATDTENDNLTFSISGSDAALFTVDTNNGQLSFTAKPDFETPASSANSNSYQLTALVSDGSLSDSADVTVNVTDVVENTELFVDSDFGNDGFVHFNSYADFEDNEYLKDAVNDSSGNIYALFNVDDGTRSEIVVAKYKPDGSFDTNFGYGGLKRIFRSFQKDPNVTEFNDYPYKLVANKIIIDDAVPNSSNYRKVYIVGGQDNASGGNDIDHPFIIRLNQDGHLDNTFGHDGTDFTNNGKYYNPNHTNHEGIDLLLHSSGDVYLLSMPSPNSGSMHLDKLSTSGLLAVSNDFTSPYGIFPNSIFENNNSELLVVGHIASDESGGSGNTKVMAIKIALDLSSSLDTLSQTVGEMLNDGVSRDVVYTAKQIDSSNIIIGGTSNYNTSFASEEDAMLIKLNIDDLALYNAANDCVALNNCFGVYDGISVINISDSDDDRVVSIDINNNDEISYVVYVPFGGGDAYGLIPSQLNSIGVPNTTIATNLESNTLSHTDAGNNSYSDVHAVVLHDSNDAENKLQIISSQEIWNNNSSTSAELETNMLTFASAGTLSSSLVRDHTASRSTLSTTISGSSDKLFNITTTDTFDGNNHGYGYEVMAHSQSNGEWDQTFNGNKGRLVITPDMNDLISYKFSDAVEMSDGSIITVNLLDIQGVDDIVISRRNADGTDHSASDITIDKSAYSSLSIVKILLNEELGRLVLLGSSEASGVASSLVIGVDINSWQVIYDNNFDVLNNGYDNKITDAVFLSNNSLVIAGESGFGQSGEFTHGYILQLNETLDGGNNITLTPGALTEVDLTNEENYTYLDQIEVNNSDEVILSARKYSYGDPTLFKYAVDSSNNFILDSTFGSAGSVVISLTDLSASGMTGDASIKDFKIVDNTIWLAGSASFGELSEAFVAKIDASTGLYHSTFGNNSLSGYFIPKVNIDCTNDNGSAVNICRVDSFDNINITADNKVIVTGYISGGNNGYDTFIIKLKELQDDTASSYTIEDNYGGGCGQEGC